MPLRARIVFAVSVAICLCPALLWAAEPTDVIYYPPGANVINVVEDLGIDNTGKTDVTDKLSKLYSDLGRHLQVVYFPKGTYLVSGTVMGKYDTSRKSSSHSHGPWLVGESRTETVLRLKDGTWPRDRLDSADMPKRVDEQVVLHTGDCTNTTFNQVIRNLTVNVGRNNAGAVGVVYITSNAGQLREVDIVSEDGKGAVGLSLSGSENGPGRIRDVRIRGFKRGVYNRAAYWMAVSDVSIEGATEVGVLNRAPLAAENLNVRMAGSGPAVRNARGGWLLLVGGRFSGEGPAAIDSDGELYLRDVETTGYAAAVETAKPGSGPSKPSAAAIEEFYTGTSAGVLAAPGRALRLPIKPAPHVPWETDPAKWANPEDYKTDDNTWTEAFQAALAQKGKTHLVIPFGQNYEVDGVLRIGNDFRRIVGTRGVIVGDEMEIVVEDGNAPAVVLEGFAASVPVRVRTGRTVVLDRLDVKPRYGGRIEIDTAGDVFLDDTVSDVRVTHPAARVWMRHFNHEHKSLALEVQAGQVWVLGWKSENLHQRLRQAGGAVEILGFQSYEVGRDKAGETPIFEVLGGRFSVAGLKQDGRAKHKVLMRAQHGGETRLLTADENPGGYDCPLCTAGAAEAGPSEHP